MIKIPFSFLPAKRLRYLSHRFYYIAQKLEHFFPNLKRYLKQINETISAREYLAMCVVASMFFYVFVTIFIIIILYFTNLGSPFLTGPVIGLIFTFFMFLQQINYPRLLANKRVHNLEKNLLSSLQSILVQLNSGVTLFNIFVNISKGNYGEVSREFEEVVSKINAGIPETDALEELATENPSLYFRRAIWQLTNGIKAGSDISTVLEEILIALGGEQLVQIQEYGSRLNPLAMFYMLIGVIIPALGITFLIVIASFIALSEQATKSVMYGLFVLVVFFQIIFLGLIKTRRPSLLSGE